MEEGFLSSGTLRILVVPSMEAQCNNAGEKDIIKDFFDAEGIKKDDSEDWPFVVGGSCLEGSRPFIEASEN